MKRFLLIFQIFLLSFYCNSQDLALAAPSGIITSPISGCGLTSNETVSVSVFNFGATLPAGTNFTLSYTVNGGAPVTEAVTLTSSFFGNSSFSYSFTNKADLSVQGTYTLTASVNIAGDGNAANNTYNNYQVISNSVSVGGTINSSSNVCIGNNSGNLTLTGNIGNILNWEYSEDNGATWINISNTTAAQSFLNIIDTTQYRAKVQNAGCSAVFSSTATLTTNPTTVAGAVSGASTKCLGAASGVLTSVGKTGTIQRWQSSPNGITWTDLVGTGNTQTYTNLLATTRYRVEVKSGACASAFTPSVAITVSIPPVGGSVAADQTVCSGNNSGTLTLSGHSGTITWQKSTNNGVSFTNVAGNTTPNLTFSNLTTNTIFRCILSSTSCPSSTSGSAQVSITSATVPGIVSTSTTVCGGSNNGALTLSGESGSVVRWESSTDGFTTWDTIINTTNSQSYSNITVPTSFRAVVQASGCNESASTAANIAVQPGSIGGTISSSATVCASSNNGSLTLSGNSGSIVKWISSTDGGLTWTSIANNSSTQTYNNLTDSTSFAAVVVNGVCPADTSDTAIIFVDPISFGGVVNSSGTACSGTNGDTLELTGNIGEVIRWELSTDGGVIWVPISNTDSSQVYGNLTTTTAYRGVVKSGACPEGYASPATISVSAPSVGGTLYGGTTVCASGNTGSLTLVGFNSNVVEWQFSVDSGLTWFPVVNSSAFQSFNNLLQTTWFQAIVVSGNCPNDTSTIAEINVDSVTVPGFVSANSTVCANQNGDTLQISGNTGNVVGWQVSTDGGATWISLANSTNSQIFSNLSTTTQFRAEIQNGVCPSSTSLPATITVDQASIAGNVSSSATVCELYNGGTLVLSGTNGSVLGWEQSSDNGLTWSPISNQTSQLTYSNLSDTTWFHAIAQSGVCVPDTGAPAVITVIPKPNTSFTANDTCFGLPTQFTNGTTVSTGYVQLYNWDFDDNSSSISGNPNHVFADTGTYNVTLVALSNFGCLDTFSLPVKVFGLPKISFSTSGPLKFCSNDSVIITAPLVANIRYIWETNDTNNVYISDTTGTWNVTATDTLSGCFTTDSISTEVIQAPEIFVGADTIIGLGNSVSLLGAGSGTYLWSPSASLDIPSLQNPVASPTVNTTYTLVVTNSNGCTATDSVKVRVEERYEFIFNSVITPNGDGFNDKWVIKNLEFYSQNEIIIFNRYGQKVFAMTDYDNSWDGTNSGALLPDGTYYFVLKFSNSDKSFTGPITLLRSSK
ncbi:MAG: gliding motility-associated C-terminal domain-containing protein [Bacteroidota bacterium]